MDTRDASETNTEFELSPFCRHLGSKKLCFRTQPPQSAEDVLDASQHVWCRRTQQVLGPDGDVVDVQDCRRGRSCFECIG